MTDVWLQLADAYDRQGRHVEALAAYKEVIARKPKDPASLTGAANALLRAGRTRRSAARMPSWRRASRRRPRTNCSRASRSASGDADSGAPRRAARAGGRRRRCRCRHSSKAVILHQQGRFDAAAEQFLEVAGGGRSQHRAARGCELPRGRLARAARAVCARRSRCFRAELALFPQHVRARARAWRCSTAPRAGPAEADRGDRETMLEHCAHARGLRHRGPALDDVRRARTGRRGAGARRTATKVKFEGFSAPRTWESYDTTVTVPSPCSRLLVTGYQQRARHVRSRRSSPAWTSSASTSAWSTRTAGPITDLRPDEIQSFEEPARRCRSCCSSASPSRPGQLRRGGDARGHRAGVVQRRVPARASLHPDLRPAAHHARQRAAARGCAAQFIRRRVRPSDRVALFAVPGPGPADRLHRRQGARHQALASIRGIARAQRRDPARHHDGVYEAHRIVQGDDEADGRRSACGWRAEAGADVVTAGDGVAGRGVRAERRRPRRRAQRARFENARAVVNQSDGAVAPVPAAARGRHRAVSATSKAARPSSCSPKASSRTTCRASSKRSPPLRRRATASSTRSTSTSAAPSLTEASVPETALGDRDPGTASRRCPRSPSKPTAC